MSLSTAMPSAAGRVSPFVPDGDHDVYLSWREHKLSAFPRTVDALKVNIEDGSRLTGREQAALHDALSRSNFAIYRLGAAAVQDKAVIRQMGRQLGLERLDNNLCSDEDGVTSLKVVAKRREGEYIPYTNKRLNWHTDGYYNSLDQQIRGVILHCVQQAATGGENALLDHEIAYIHLRDENPAFIHALMAPDAMTIPPNVQNGREIRPLQSGPVFSVDASGHLHMRYSARTRNIIWKDDVTTKAAAECLLALFQQDSPYIFRHRLKSGEGVLSNNVLHCRTSFEDSAEEGQARLLYRARYFDRVVDMRNQ